MRTLHTTFSLARQTIHQITFELATFSDADLLWLPHHQQLAHAARKRKAEHLAGRIAAAHSLQEFSVRAIPGIGGERFSPEKVKRPPISPTFVERLRPHSVGA